MATELEDKQESPTSVNNPDPGQAHFDREFDGITAPENYNNDAVSSGQLKGLEEKSGAENSDENGADPNLIGGGFNPAGDMSKFQAVSKIVGGFGRKKAAVGGGIAAGVIGLVIFAFISLLPLKLVHMMSNLQDRFFTTSDIASASIGDKLFQQYLVTKVMPGMIRGKCSSTRVDRSCADLSNTNNPVSALYNTWRTANLENKLYQQNGLEIVRDGNKFYFRSDNLRERVFLGEYNETNTRDFNNRAYSELSRSQIRREVRTAVENETLRKRLMYRYSVGKLLERKYGIKRCIMACNARDKFNDSLDVRKTAFKSLLTERVLTPRSEAMGLALACALNSFSCANPESSNANGEQQSDYERDLQARLQDYRARYGATSLTELQAESEKMSQNGFADYVVRRIAGEAGGKIISKAIPIVGWVDMGAQLLASGQNAGPAIRKINYVMNTTGMIQQFALYSTAADEIKSGEVDSEVLGSISSSFDANPLNDQGGGAAEDSPLYGEIMGGTGNKPLTVASAIFPSAFAEEAKSTEHKCDDGKPVEEILGKKVCPEVSFDAQSKTGKIADAISEATSSGPLYFAGAAANVYNQTIGAAFNFIVGSISEKLAQLSPVDLASIVNWVKDNIFAKILVNPFSDKPSGGRNLELAAGGAAAAAADYGQYGLGAPAATQTVLNEIQEQKIADQTLMFENKSLYERMFSTDDTNSMVSRLAMTLPSNSSSFSKRATTKLVNPIDSIGSGFAALFTSKTKAAEATNKNYFGITEAAWPLSHPVFSSETNLESYWDQNDCSNPDQVKNWGDKGIVDPKTLLVTHAEGNPCMLMRVGTEISGGKYDSSLIRNDSTSTSAGATPTDSPVIVPGDVFGSSAGMPCPVGSRDGGDQKGYRDGTPVTIKVCYVGTTGVNAKIAGNMMKLVGDANAQGVKLGLGSGFRTMAEQQALYQRNCGGGKRECDPDTATPGFSNHQMGLAIDFTYNGKTICFKPDSVRRTANCIGNPGLEWMKVNAAKYGLKNYYKEAWHWSVDGS